MTLRRSADGVDAPASPSRLSSGAPRNSSLPPGEEGTVERATAAASLLHDTLGALWGMAAALRAAGRPVPPTAGVRPLALTLTLTLTQTQTLTLTLTLTLTVTLRYSP
eukprot:scaffold29742_cov37-Phaeocystis_antarctica.AAC.2